MIKWLEKNPIISITITILIAIFIFYISSLSFEKGSPGPPWEFKSFIYHFGIFFLLAFFLSISLAKGKCKNKTLIFIAVLISLMYAASDEIHQYFVPNRACTIEDFLTNSAGILMAGIFYLVKINNGKK
jgi:VanZ family protein